MRNLNKSFRLQLTFHYRLHLSLASGVSFPERSHEKRVGDEQQVLQILPPSARRPLPPLRQGKFYFMLKFSTLVKVSGNHRALTHVKVYLCFFLSISLFIYVALSVYLSVCPLFTSIASYIPWIFRSLVFSCVLIYFAFLEISTRQRERIQSVFLATAFKV